MHDGMPYGRNQGQGQGHSREVDRQSPTGLIFLKVDRINRGSTTQAQHDSVAQGGYSSLNSPPPRKSGHWYPSVVVPRPLITQPRLLSVR